MPPSRKQDLIEAAVRVFSRDGFHASGLERILHESGVSRMTLYSLFINAAAEFIDPASEPRRIAADHKLEITRLIRTLCEGLSCADPEHAAEQVALLIDGAIVSAHVIAQAWQTDAAAPARAARDMAMLVIERESAASSHA